MKNQAWQKYSRVQARAKKVIIRRGRDAPIQHVYGQPDQTDRKREDGKKSIEKIDHRKRL